MEAFDSNTHEAAIDKSWKNNFGQTKTLLQPLEYEFISSDELTMVPSEMNQLPQSNGGYVH